MKTELDKMYDRLWQMSEGAARDWWEKQIKNEYASLYLYYQPTERGKWGNLAVSEDRPLGFELASNERLSPASTRDRMTQKIRGMLNTLPIVGNEDEANLF